MGRGQAPSPYPTPLKSFYLKKKMIMCASWRGRPVNGIASELPRQRRGTFIVFFWQWQWMSMVIRLKVPIEMHYAVIPMGTSKVNSSRVRWLKQCRLEVAAELQQWWRRRRKSIPRSSSSFGLGLGTSTFYEGRSKSFGLASGGKDGNGKKSNGKKRQWKIALLENSATSNKK